MFHGIAAYEGQTSIPYVASSGKSGTATVTGSVNCGDSFGLQQALKDLGYSVTVDGQVGNETFKALRLFAEANGVAYTPSTFPKGDLCGAIAAAWQAKQAPPPPVAPPADVKKGLLSPVFYAAQKSGLVSKLGRQIAPMSQEGGEGGGVTGWWSEQSTGAKVAMGVGALALVGGLLWYALSPGEATKAKAKANRRRRAKRNAAAKFQVGDRVTLRGALIGGDGGTVAQVNGTKALVHWDGPPFLTSWVSMRELKRLGRRAKRNAAAKFRKGDRVQWGSGRYVHAGTVYAVIGRDVYVRESGSGVGTRVDAKALRKIARRAHKNYRGKKRGYARVIREGLPKTCRTKRRKGYPKKRSKYALPECMMYPLRTKKEVRNAASRFGHWKFRYSPAVRAKIAHRLDRAKKRFKIGEYRVVRRRRRAR